MKEDWRDKYDKPITTAAIILFIVLVIIALYGKYGPQNPECEELCKEAKYIGQNLVELRDMGCSCE